MLKYFCDRCNKEMTEYDYRSSVVIKMYDNSYNYEDDNDEHTYHICGSCEFDFKAFMKEGENNDLQKQD